mgnify:CR=1 FL=1
MKKISIKLFNINKGDLVYYVEYTLCGTTFSLPINIKGELNFKLYFQIIC